MILYLLIISAAVVTISGIVTPIMNVNIVSALGATSFAVLVVVLIDGLTATLCRLLPTKFANHQRKLYTVSAKEKKFYEKLRIRKWKDYIPEIGHFTGFRKNRIADPKSVEYLDRFLLETCYGELGHILSVFTGFLLLLFFPISRIWLAVSTPVAFINALLNLPSLFILRYNSYKLEVLRKSTLKKQARAQAIKEINE